MLRSCRHYSALWWHVNGCKTGAILCRFWACLCCAYWAFLERFEPRQRAKQSLLGVRYSAADHWGDLKASIINLIIVLSCCRDILWSSLACNDLKVGRTWSEKCRWRWSEWIRTSANWICVERCHEAGRDFGFERAGGYDGLPLQGEKLFLGGCARLRRGRYLAGCWYMVEGADFELWWLLSELLVHHHTGGKLIDQILFSL